MTAPPDPHRRRSTARGRGARHICEVIALASMLAGCAVTFGEPPDPSAKSRTPSIRQRNSLYLEEQERIQQRRQQGALDPLYPER